MPLINSHAVVSIKARCLNFGLSLHLHLYFEYASSEGSGESARADSPEPSLLVDAISTKFCALVQMSPQK